VPSATQATARALETESLAQALEHEAPEEELHRRLRRAAALYATCGDASGFDRTKRHLSQLVPEHEPPTLFPHVVVDQQALAKNPEVQRAFARLESELDDGAREHGAPRRQLLQTLLNFAWYQQKSPQLAYDADEAACVEAVRSFLAKSGEPGEVEVPAGNGKIDLLVQGIPIEVKRAKTRSDAAEQRYRLQLSRYILAQGQAVGVLMIFHFVAGDRGEFPPPFNQLISRFDLGERPARSAGRDAGISRMSIVQIVVPVFAATPSRSARTARLGG
jgi:hypothetical protein